MPGYEYLRSVPTKTARCALTEYDTTGTVDIRVFVSDGSVATNIVDEHHHVARKWVDKAAVSEGVLIELLQIRHL